MNFNENKGGIGLKFIFKRRGEGKTHGLIIESAKTGARILTPYDTYYIRQKAKKMGVEIPAPIHISQVNSGIFQGTSGSLLIDEVDTVLEGLLGKKVNAVTCTPDSLRDEAEEAKRIDESVRKISEQILSLNDLLREYRKITNRNINLTFSEDGSILKVEKAKKSRAKKMGTDYYYEDLNSTEIPGVTIFHDLSSFIKERRT